jgi:hypothetical protein
VENIFGIYIYIYIYGLDRDALFADTLNKGNILHDLGLHGINSSATSYPFISLMHMCWLASGQLCITTLLIQGRIQSELYNKLLFL